MSHILHFQKGKPSSLVENLRETVKKCV